MSIHFLVGPISYHLLCFFVLLFSMSTVDADKYEQLVTSMTESINIFDGGGKAVGEGAFVSSGTDQLVSISQYFNEFENSGEDTQEKQDQKTQEEWDSHQQGTQSQGDKPLEDDKKAEERYEAKNRSRYICAQTSPPRTTPSSWIGIYISMRLGNA